ncbi:MAG: glycosyltransferase [Phycisphaerales bacterium]|nr:glycosyltransferase [Phycisphaerales bacterium]
MRILMLGWEFPPFIAGGLGTACYGLTKALDRLGHEVIFVLPRPVEQAHTSHIQVVSPAGSTGAASAPAAAPSDAETVEGVSTVTSNGLTVASAGAVFGERSRVRAPIGWSQAYRVPDFEHAVFRAVPATFSSPYRVFTGAGESGAAGGLPSSPGAGEANPSRPQGTAGVGDSKATDPSYAAAGVGGSGGEVSSAAGHGYGHDMMGDADRYSRLVVAMCRGERFDVIHAHDWMTFPAGLALAQVSGKPLVAHVHSTEFDRSGEHPNQRIYDLERRGMHGALRTIAVSNLTRSICMKRYGLSADRIDVVWNGIDSPAGTPPAGARINPKDRIVLFLGRITMQKGPEYFIAAAKRVLEKVPEAKFVVAGSGDMYERMVEQAAQLGIGHKVLFTGFLRGPQVDRIFRMADCYVMPSVSEPFGIAPLEAMRNDVPVIISKQSGVSEVVTHALKVDFWDIDDMANKIVAVLRYPPLGQTLREHGSFELRKLTWEGAAEKCVQTYGAAIGAQARRAKG